MGFDAADPFSRRQEEMIPPPWPAGAGFRFGLPEPGQLKFFANAAVESLYRAAADRLAALGGQAVTVDCQPFFQAGRLLYDGPWLAERAGGLKDFLLQHAGDLLPEIRAILEPGLRIDAAACFEGLHQLAALCQAARQCWQEMDLLLLPTAGTIYRIEQIAADPIALNKTLGYYTSFVNLMDLCAVAVPAGFSGDGLPAGVSLIAPAGRDARLAEIGQRLQLATGLKLGATNCPMPPAPSIPPASQAVDSQRVLLAVVGAHLSGQPLNGQLTSRGGQLVRACRTWPCYRLFALANTTPAKPGLLRLQRDGGAAIEVEVWSLSRDAFGSFVSEVPPPMAIGTLRLEDGSWVKGFLCEPCGMAGATDISSLGGWRAYCRGL
jgi:allophanate hydrolase